jgi:hypothetical protein
MRRTILTGAAVAGVIALSATGGAIAAGQIGSAGVKDNSLQSVDYKDRSVKIHDTGDGVQERLKHDAGVRHLESDGPYPGRSDSQNNLQNLPGNQGAQSTELVHGNTAAIQTVWVQCPTGKLAVGPGGFTLAADAGPAAAANLQVVAAYPTQVEGGALVYEPRPGDAAGSFVPNGYAVDVINNGTADVIVRPHVTCGVVATR